MSPLQGKYGDEEYHLCTILLGCRTKLVITLTQSLSLIVFTTTRYGGKMPLDTACEQFESIKPFHPNGRIDVDIAYNFKTTGIPLFAHR